MQLRATPQPASVIVLAVVAVPVLRNLSHHPCENHECTAYRTNIHSTRYIRTYLPTRAYSHGPINQPIHPASQTHRCTKRTSSEIHRTAGAIPPASSQHAASAAQRTPHHTDTWAQRADCSSTVVGRWLAVELNCSMGILTAG